MLVFCRADVLVQQSARLIVLQKVFPLVSTWVFWSQNSLRLNFLSSDNYVHRLVASKTDGKIVQYECEGDMCQEEKIDALQLEVNILACWALHCAALWKCFRSSNHYREMISADAADLLPVHRQSFSCRSRMFLLPFLKKKTTKNPLLGSAEPMQRSVSLSDTSPALLPSPEQIMIILYLLGSFSCPS